MICSWDYDDHTCSCCGESVACGYGVMASDTENYFCQDCVDSTLNYCECCGEYFEENDNMVECDDRFEEDLVCKWCYADLIKEMEYEENA